MWIATPSAAVKYGSGAEVAPYQSHPPFPLPRPPWTRHTAHRASSAGSGRPAAWPDLPLLHTATLLCLGQGMEYCLKLLHCLTSCPAYGYLFPHVPGPGWSARAVTASVRAAPILVLRSFMTARVSPVSGRIEYDCCLNTGNIPLRSAKPLWVSPFYPITHHRSGPTTCRKGITRLVHPVPMDAQADSS